MFALKVEHAQPKPDPYPYPSPILRWISSSLDGEFEICSPIVIVVCSILKCFIVNFDL